MENDNDNTQYRNVSDENRQGLNELMKLINDKEAIALETDKSKKWGIIEPQIYKDDMYDHIKNNKMISQK